MALANGIGIGIPFTVSTGDPYAWDGDTSSFLYDGVDEYMDTPDDSITVSTPISWSFWVRMIDTATDNQALFCKDAQSTNRSFLCYYRSTGKIQAVIWNANGSSASITSTTSVNDSAWHHVAVTYDGTSDANKSILYIDGVSDITGTAPSTGIRDYTGSNSGVAIGALSTGSLGANANIDEPALWLGTELTAGDITTIYNGGLPTDIIALAPTYWWRSEFAEYSSSWTMVNVMDDTVASMSSTNMEEGDRVPNVPAWGFLLDGVDEQFITPNNPTFAPTVSLCVSFWFKVVDTAGSVQVLVCHDSFGGSARDWLIYYRGTASGYRKLFFTVIHPDASVTELLSSTTGAFEDGAWHFIVGAWDGTTDANAFKLYVDGVLDAQKTASSTGIRNYTGTWSGVAVGGTSAGSGVNAFGGNMFDVGLWGDSTILTPTQVSEIYNSGFPLSLSSYNPDVWWKLGNDATWDGSDWTVPNAMNAGTDDLTSVNMEEGDRIQDVP